MAPKIDFIIDSSSAGIALKNGILATENSCKAEHDHLLEKSIRFKMENELLEKLILDKNVAMKTMPTCLVDMAKRS